MAKVDVSFKTEIRTLVSGLTARARARAAISIKMGAGTRDKSGIVSLMGLDS